MLDERNHLIALILALLPGPRPLDFENLVKGIGQGSVLNRLPVGATYEQMVTSIVDAAIEGAWILDLVRGLERSFPKRTELAVLREGFEAKPAPTPSPEEPSLSEGKHTPAHPPPELGEPLTLPGRPIPRWLPVLLGVLVLIGGGVLSLKCRDHDDKAAPFLVVSDRYIRDLSRVSSPFEIEIGGKRHRLPAEGLLFAKDYTALDQATYEKLMGAGKPQLAGPLQRPGEHLQIVIYHLGTECLRDRVTSGTTVWEFKFSQCSSLQQQ